MAKSTNETNIKIKSGATIERSFNNIYLGDKTNEDIAAIVGDILGVGAATEAKLDEVLSATADGQAKLDAAVEYVKSKLLDMDASATANAEAMQRAMQARLAEMKAAMDAHEETYRAEFNKLLAAQNAHADALAAALREQNADAEARHVAVLAALRTLAQQEKETKEAVDKGFAQTVEGIAATQAQNERTQDMVAAGVETISDLIKRLTERVDALPTVGVAKDDDLGNARLNMVYEMNTCYMVNRSERDNVECKNAIDAVMARKADDPLARLFRALCRHDWETVRRQIDAVADTAEIDLMRQAAGVLLRYPQQEFMMKLSELVRRADTEAGDYAALWEACRRQLGLVRDHYDVFIAYSSADYAIVQRVMRELQDAGISCFVAREVLPYSNHVQYHDELARSFANCDIMLFISSRNARCMDTTCGRDVCEAMTYEFCDLLARRHPDMPFVEYVVEQYGKRPFDLRAERAIKKFRADHPDNAFEAVYSTLAEAETYAAAPTEEDVDTLLMRVADVCDWLERYRDEQKKKSIAAAAAALPRGDAEIAAKAKVQRQAEADYVAGRRYATGDGMPQDWAIAVAFYRKAANHDHAAAQNELGDCYYYGHGVEQDYAQAVAWYRKAVAQGLAAAQNNLGFCYASGNGIAQDYKKAAEWYRQAAEQGLAVAQNNLGYAYEMGKGVAQDYGQALAWYQKAAAQGVAIAQNNIGNCYKNGNGIAQDYKKAAEWYRQAAEKGNAAAQANLGDCYFYGQGVVQDIQKASFWCRKAAAQNHEGAKKRLQAIKTASKREKADHRAATLGDLRREGDYVYFGTWPQTIKADGVTITETKDERGYYLGSDGEYYAKVKATPCSNMYVFSNGAAVEKGQEYYFKVEPIRWRMAKGGLLVCDSIIANHRFDKADNNYEQSEIRAWLRDTFLQTAFTDAQRKEIPTVEIDNSLQSTGDKENKYICSNTQDQVFLLSYQELDDGASRWRRTCDYSRATGISVCTFSPCCGNGYWWLRSPYYYNINSARVVPYNGSAGYSNNVSCTDNGVVPALRVRSIEEEIKKRKQEEQKAAEEAARKQREAEEKRRAEEAARKQREAEEKRKAEEEAARKQREAEEKHRAEEAARKQREAEEKRRAEEAERKRQFIETAQKRAATLGDLRREGDYVYFGTWPQTLKADGVTITEIKDERGYYLGSDGEYYAKVTPNKSGDVFSNGEAVKQGQEYYFKVEPIRWRITNTGLLVCDSIIANHRFDESSNNYEQSEIRSWLHKTFLQTAFTASQRKDIPTVEVDNSARSTGVRRNQYACSNTKDQVFLLSYQEAKKLGNDSSRRRRTCDYSLAMGAYMNTDGTYNGNGCWWLRSPNYNDSFIARIVYGSGDADDCNYVGDAGGGVVPALKMKLS